MQLPNELTLYNSLARSFNSQTNIETQGSGKIIVMGLIAMITTAATNHTIMKQVSGPKISIPYPYEEIQNHANQLGEVSQKKASNRVFGDFKGKMVIKDGFFDPLPDEIIASFYGE